MSWFWESFRTSVKHENPGCGIGIGDTRVPRNEVPAPTPENTTGAGHVNTDSKFEPAFSICEKYPSSRFWILILDL